MTQVDPDASSDRHEGGDAPRGELFSGDAGLRDRGALWAVWVVVAAAAVLRLVFASRKGLVLDEFHSTFHSTRESFGALLETLRLDNHPPLSLLAIRASRAAFGDGELALRAPALAFGLLEILLVARIARRLLGAPVAWVAAGLLAVSSLHVDFSSQARMYALLALAVTGLIEAVTTVLATAPGEPAGAARSRAGLWIAVGLLTHYFFLQYLVWIALVLGLACRTPALRTRVLRLVLPTGVAVLFCLPWYLTGFREQLVHGLPPGGKDVGLLALAEAFVHLFYLNVRLGGPFLRLVFIASGGLALALAAAGLVALLRELRQPTERASAALLGCVAVVVPAAATAAALAVARAGFTWHYVLPSAAAAAVLVAANVALPGATFARRVGVAIVAAGALTLTILNVASRGREDYPGAVAAILEAHRPGDAVIAVEWQPAFFPQGGPWDYYAPRLTPAGAEAPQRLAMTGFTLARPRELESFERVLLLRTSLPADQHLMRLLTERFRLEWTRNFGFGVDVLLFVAR